MTSISLCGKVNSNFVSTFPVRENVRYKDTCVMQSSTGYLASFIICCGSDTKYILPADIDFAKRF